MSVPLYHTTILESADLLRRGQVSSVDLTEAYLERIKQVEGVINAYVTVVEEQAMDDARRADERIAHGEANLLCGVPMQIKDVMCTRGIRTTCASRMLEDFIPPYDATVVERLKGAGAVLLGKGNMDEFAMGSSTENSAFKTTANPWDVSRVPGGSSGGGAAAVIAGEAAYALGSDTGGSIRQPAALCGAVGLKPTYGRVSRYGLVAFASSLDQIGPITRTVEDSALVLQAIAGYDPLDSTSIPGSVPDYRASLRDNLNGLRIGVPREYFGEGIQPEVEKATRDAIGVLEDLGAIVDWDVSLPLTRKALAVYYIIAPSECSANLARYDGVKYGFSYSDASSMWEAMELTREHGFGPEVKRRIMLGTYALSSGYYDAYYKKAQQVRTLIKHEFQEAFEKYDVLVSPVSPTVAFQIGEKASDPVQMYLNDILTIPMNIAGLPGLSVPAGFVDGLPVGLHLMGSPLAEETLFGVGHAYENATSWYLQRPSL